MNKDIPIVPVVVVGCGTVGSGVVKKLTDPSCLEEIAARNGFSLKLAGIVVENPDKQRDDYIPTDLIIPATDFEEAIGRGDVVVYLTGNNASQHHLETILNEGKWLVTADKNLANHPYLHDLALQKGVYLFCGASAGGFLGFPSFLDHRFPHGGIEEVVAIPSGTNTYILDRMTPKVTKDEVIPGVSFKKALKEAQKLGYAEKDPTADIGGYDARNKLAFLVLRAFKAEVLPRDIYLEGITGLTSEDFREAHKIGYAIKYVAIAKKVDGGIDARVHPVLVKDKLAMVDENNNALVIKTVYGDSLMLMGPGAGQTPTADMVLADTVNAAKMMLSRKEIPRYGEMELKGIIPLSEAVSKFYMRFLIRNKPAEASAVTGLLGSMTINMTRFSHEEASGKWVPAYIMTDAITHKAFDRALNTLTTMPEHINKGYGVRWMRIL